ncbi:class I SAM-dependent methyltransferase [Candidatus Uhrbacteria bacterium]|nr:class I SAM-dependent methyltransferase [Candidatus Uhrbacteria bacterium]
MRIAMYSVKEIQSTYNRIAEDWHKDHLGDTWWQESMDEFCRQLPHGAEVLDVGCAGGVKTDLLRRRGFRATGIDLSDGLIAVAKREFPESEFRHLDMRDVGSLGKKFDGIYALAVLLHMPKAEIDQVLAGWAAAMKPDGRLFLGVKERREGQPEEDVIEETDYGYSYQRFFSFFSPDELRQRLHRAGLDIVCERSDLTGNTRWIKIISKKRGL